MAQWLLGAAAAAVVLGTVTAASSADIRVGFVNPTGPPAFWNQVNATMVAAASQLGNYVDIRETERARDKAIAFATEFASRRPALYYLSAGYHQHQAGDISKISHAAHLKLLFLNVDRDKKDYV